MENYHIGRGKRKIHRESALSIHVFTDCKAKGDSGSLSGVNATDAYLAKIKLWVAEASRPDAKPPHCPIPEKLPYFTPQRFSSYTELNAWKRRYLLEIARQGGVKWKKSSRD